MLQKLSDIMIRISSNRYLRAIRDGVVATLPLIIVGSIFLIIAFPPFTENSTGIFKSIYDWTSDPEVRGAILLPYRMTMFIMTLYAVMGIGHSLAASYELDELSGSIIALMGYLLTIVPKVVSPISVTNQVIDGQTVQTISEEGSEVIQEGLGFVLPMQNLGSTGLFVGMIVAIFAVEVLRFTKKNNITIKMPDSVPPSVANSFASLLPTLLVLLVVSTLTYWLNVDLHGLIGNVMQGVVQAGDSFISVLVLVLLITMFWSFGIHGVSIIGTLARPVWLSLFDANTLALTEGREIPNVAPEQFYQWFIWVGGAGATIGLSLLLAFRAKSKAAKTLGKTALVPAIFNINEPLIFGAPIVFNPILIPPFIIAPVVNAIIAYWVISAGLVNRIVASPPWTLPGPIGAYLATNDVRAIGLNVILIIISIVIYYPFFVKYDKLQVEATDIKDS